ncbi:hypothetical protein ACFW0F_05265 [Brucella anthropi]|uniref:hypothetical protein n=1 Tax=Brucella anthropi TaxID=529 RepID=UPI0036700A4C
MTKSKPLLSHEAFVELHTALEAKILRLTNTPTGRYKLCEKGIDNLMPESAMSLKATNTASRIEYAVNTHKFLDDHFREHPGTQMSFVTLAPRSCCAPIDGNHAAAIEELQILLYEYFGGFNFYGFIEPGLYANFASDPRQKKTLAWHAHILVWDECPAASKDIAEIIADFTRRYEALVPGKVAGHVRSVGRESALSRVWYMSKAPLKDYHVYRVIGTGLYKTRKRQLRPGEAVRLHNIMVDMTIPELCVSNFQGDKIANMAEQRSIENLEQCNQVRLAKIFQKKARAWQ